MSGSQTIENGRVLVIAGSDSGGGAGIQADIKTITMLGAYAATAITAITVQNSLGVSDIHVCPNKLVSDQIDCVLSDIGADTVKIGMLADAAVIQSVVDSLACFKGQVIVDPVMIATSGDCLLDKGAIQLLQRLMIPRASVLTPNIPEAEMLTGMTINHKDHMRDAGQKLLDMGAKAVIIKGGHLCGDKLYDLLLSKQDTMMLETTRIDTKHTHGTGCTFASALAAALAKGSKLSDAFRIAHAFVHEAIKKAPHFGAGHGPLGHSQVRVCS